MMLREIKQLRHAMDVIKSRALVLNNQHLTLSSRRPDLPRQKIIIESKLIQSLTFPRQQTLVANAHVDHFGAAL